MEQRALETSPPQATPAAQQELCTSPGCVAQPATRCAYVDRRHVSCPTAWCGEHSANLEGNVFCRRHAGVVQAMLAIPAAERDYPDLDNRAPSLCEWTAARCDAYVSQLLQSVAARHPGSTFTTNGLHLLIGGIPRVHAWEHTWRVVDHTGPLYTVSIRVEEPRDSLVIVKVNNTVILDAVPPWITDRVPGSAAEGLERREEFDRRLLTAVYERVRALVPP